MFCVMLLLFKTKVSRQSRRERKRVLNNIVVVEIRGVDDAVFVVPTLFEERRTNPILMRNIDIIHCAAKHEKLHFVNRFVAKSWQEKTIIFSRVISCAVRSADISRRGSRLSDTRQHLLLWAVL